MKTYKERTEDIMSRVRNKQMQRRKTIRTAVAACGALSVVAVMVMALMPFWQKAPNVDKYAENEYYEVISKLNVLTYTPPSIDGWFSDIFMMGAEQGFAGSVPEADKTQDVAPALPDENTAGAEQYKEITDNQEAGVIEGDIIKRSNKYVYYLKHNVLTIYSIEKEESKMVSEYVFESRDGYKLMLFQGETELFLSKDCNTLTLITSAYYADANQKLIAIISLDVSNPEKMTELNRTYLSGNYLSARMVEDRVLLMSHYRLVESNIDYDRPESFVPQYGPAGNMDCIRGEDIICPETLDDTNYTIVCMLDAKTLEAKDMGAFLSFSQDVYVSKDHIYAAREYSKENDTEKDKKQYRETVTDIAAMKYSGEGLEYIGGTTVAGRIKDQYSMDEENGILRVVTTVEKNAGFRTTNASLYCLDIQTWKTVAAVENFAPENETVQSVRFDGNYAYVCTAEVVTVTDPVYYFDMTDLNNIIVKDTGTIDGYSTSLIDFGDYLLGIGVGADGSSLKLEVYTETKTGVESVAAYERECDFATVYKAYYIDRERMRIGIGVEDWQEDENGGREKYILLQFDGYEFFELLVEDMGYNNNYNYYRAFEEEDYFYIFGENFAVKPLW